MPAMTSLTRGTSLTGEGRRKVSAGRCPTVRLWPRSAFWNVSWVTVGPNCRVVPNIARRCTNGTSRHRCERGERPRTHSRQPTLAALIVLHVAERLPLAFRDAEIELLDVLVLRQRFRLAVHDDAAVFQDVTVTGVSERHVGVLFGEQE